MRAIIGIDIKLRDRSGYNPLLLLECIDIEDFIWHMPQEELLSDSIGSDVESLLGKEIYTGSELKQLIDSKGFYPVLLINLRAFPPGAQITEPKTYDEYEQSNCFLVFLVCDCCYVEIYCKDEVICNRILSECGQIEDVERFEYKTSENDGRTGLYV